MTLPEEQLAELLEQRATLLCMIGAHEKRRPTSGGTGSEGDESDVPLLREKLARVEEILAEAGMRFASQTSTGLAPSR